MLGAYSPGANSPGAPIGINGWGPGADDDIANPPGLKNAGAHMSDLAGNICAQKANLYECELLYGR